MAVIPAQVGVELGVTAPTPLQSEQWAAWIDKALYLIGKRLDVSTLNPADVDYVVLEAVVQHARHPGNETQVTTSVDDASSSRTYRSSTGRVVIPDDLWGLLDPDLANESGVGSTQLYGEPDVPDYGPWVGL